LIRDNILCRPIRDKYIDFNALAINVLLQTDTHSMLSTKVDKLYLTGCLFIMDGSPIGIPYLTSIFPLVSFFSKDLNFSKKFSFKFILGPANCIAAIKHMHQSALNTISKDVDIAY